MAHVGVLKVLKELRISRTCANIESFVLIDYLEWYCSLHNMI